MLRLGNAGTIEGTLYSIWEDNSKLLNPLVKLNNTMWIKKCRSNYSMRREGLMKVEMISQPLLNLDNAKP
jgi:hypothetical protein